MAPNTCLQPPASSLFGGIVSAMTAVACPSGLKARFSQHATCNLPRPSPTPCVAQRNAAFFSHTIRLQRFSCVFSFALCVFLRLAFLYFPLFFLIFFFSDCVLALVFVELWGFWGFSSVGFDCFKFCFRMIASAKGVARFRFRCDSSLN